MEFFWQWGGSGGLVKIGLGILVFGGDLFGMIGTFFVLVWSIKCLVEDKKRTHMLLNSIILVKQSCF